MYYTQPRRRGSSRCSSCSRSRKLLLKEPVLHNLLVRPLLLLQKRSLAICAKKFLGRRRRRGPSARLSSFLSLPSLGKRMSYCVWASLPASPASPKDTTTQSSSRSPFLLLLVSDEDEDVVEEAHCTGDISRREQHPERNPWDIERGKTRECPAQLSLQSVYVLPPSAALGSMSSYLLQPLLDVRERRRRRPHQYWSVVRENTWWLRWPGQPMLRRKQQKALQTQLRQQQQRRPAECCRCCCCCCQGKEV